MIEMELKDDDGNRTTIIRVYDDDGKQNVTFHKTTKFMIDQNYEEKGSSFIYERSEENI